MMRGARRLHPAAAFGVASNSMTGDQPEYQVWRLATEFHQALANFRAVGGHQRRGWFLQSGDYLAVGAAGSAEARTVALEYHNARTVFD